MSIGFLGTKKVERSNSQATFGYAAGQVGRGEQVDQLCFFMN